MILTITRRYGETETLGWLKIDGDYFCRTLELPWKDNQHQISCIPEGVYQCRIRPSKDYGFVIELKDVPARSAILIHPGNTAIDTRGCILPGLLVGELKGHRAVLLSRRAQKVLLQMAKGNKLTVEIREES